VRRRAPRPLAASVQSAAAALQPPSLLGRVQAEWPPAVGAAVAGEAQPVSEREGSLTVACSSSLWASELELMEPELRASLNARLGGAATGGPVVALRFVTRA